MDTSKHSSERVTILIVEDNPVERQLVSKILRNADFEVLAVDCGGVVLETFCNNQPDLILLDALLPDIDGFDVCEQLRAHPMGAYVPIVMLTGLDDVVSINRSYESGATDFFTKPINHSLLVHRIRYLLRARQAMDKLRVSEQSLANAHQVAKLGHWEFNLDKRRLNVSEGFRHLYQFYEQQDSADYCGLFQRCHPSDLPLLEKAYQKATGEEREARIEYRIVLDDGSERYMDLHMMLMKDQRGISSSLLGISMDITGRKESEREIMRLAYFDRLTGLPNRSLLELYLDQAIPHFHVRGSSVAVLALDLDLFNRVNNAMGYGAGDAVLQQLTERLSKLSECRDALYFLDRLSRSEEIVDDEYQDMIARLAADTFIIVLSGAGQQDMRVANCAQLARNMFHEPFIYRGQELFVTASIGIAYSESGGTVAETLLQQADLALHEAKLQGRNEIREYSGDLVTKASNHLSIQSDLRRALKNNEFRLVYQPKVDAHDRTVCGFEALIRWYHPDKGMVPPDKFITVAEETGQIVEIGAWVLETACAQNQRWIEQGIIDVRMAVNVSARQFKERNLVGMVESVLARTGLAPEKLELEITEGVIMSSKGAEVLLDQLRSAGISVALDDFGTGYSSLSYISRFPIDTIKIDRCFVQDITHDSDQAAIVSAVTSISSSLGFNVVAEGVETEEEMAVIRDLGCNQVQGYLCCRPLSAEDVEKWLKKRQSPVKSLISAN